MYCKDNPRRFVRRWRPIKKDTFGGQSQNMNESKKPYASVGGTELSLWDITKILLAKIHWLLLAGVVVAAGVYAVVTIFVTPTY